MAKPKYSQLPTAQYWRFVWECLKRTCSDTWGFFGFNVRSLLFGVAGISGWPVLLLLLGKERLMEEVGVKIAFVLVPFGLLSVGLLLVNGVLAPFRVWRDALKNWQQLENHLEDEKQVLKTRVHEIESKAPELIVTPEVKNGWCHLRVFNSGAVAKVSAMCQVLRSTTPILDGSANAGWPVSWQFIDGEFCDIPQDSFKILALSARLQPVSNYVKKYLCCTGWNPGEPQNTRRVVLSVWSPENPDQEYVLRMTFGVDPPSLGTNVFDFRLGIDSKGDISMEAVSISDI